MPIHPQAQEVLDLMQSSACPSCRTCRSRTPATSSSRWGPSGRDPMSPRSGRQHPGPGGEIPMRLYRPAGSSPSDQLPVLVYFHGGGWVIGNLDSHDARPLAGQPRRRRRRHWTPARPRAVFPAAVDDCWAATRGSPARRRGSASTRHRLVVGGDSAGGNLAAVVALLAHDTGAPAIRLQMLVYPAVDARMGHPSVDENGTGYLLSKADMTWFYGHYGLGQGVQADDWRISPLLSPSLAGVAPAYVITAEFDPLRDEGEAYAAALEAAGVPVQHRRFDGMIHGFFGMVGAIDAADEAQEEAAKAIMTAVG